MSELAAAAKAAEAGVDEIAVLRAVDGHLKRRNDDPRTATWEDANARELIQRAIEWLRKRNARLAEWAKE